MFILADDAVGRAVVDALVEQALRGVSVRVIVDAVGSSRAYRRAAPLLRAAAADVRAFMPLRHSPIKGRTNLRSHRKLVIFDAEQVFVGGMNVADEYMGPPRAPSSSARWRDVAAVVSGPVAADATALFESDWSFCGGQARAPDDRRIDARGDALAQVVASGPDMLTDTVYDAFLAGIFAAQERIVIVTPYYVPDETLQHALVLAARRGVRTEVVVPARSNHRIADIARRRLLSELSAAGVKVHYYPRGMVHAKAMVIDSLCAYIGSPNFDMRSLFLNYESALFVYSHEAIAQIRSFAVGLVAESVAEAPSSRANWVVEQIARLLAPEL
jgi:cardiolipin synthase